jgi:hypothetical protein
LKEKNVLVIIVALLMLFIAGAGCLQENGPGQLPTTTPPAEVSQNSSMNATSTESTITPTTTYPSEQFGVRIFKEADSICVGQDLNFGLINEGNSTIGFGVGNPYKIQIFQNESWGDLYPGGGTMAFWYLNPGEKYERNLYFGDLMTFYSNPVDYFTIIPGLYRIIFLGTENSDEPFAVATEFTVQDCEQKEPN